MVLDAYMQVNRLRIRTLISKTSLYVSVRTWPNHATGSCRLYSPHVNVCCNLLRRAVISRITMTTLRSSRRHLQQLLTTWSPITVMEWNPHSWKAGQLFLCYDAFMMLLGLVFINKNLNLSGQLQRGKVSALDCNLKFLVCLYISVGVFWP